MLQNAVIVIHHGRHARAFKTLSCTIYVNRGWTARTTMREHRQIGMGGDVRAIFDQFGRRYRSEVRNPVPRRRAPAAGGGHGGKTLELRRTRSEYVVDNGDDKRLRFGEKRAKLRAFT